jgi:hypothetical protein
MSPKDQIVIDWELLALESPLAVALQIRGLLKEGKPHSPSPSGKRAGVRDYDG